MSALLSYNIVGKGKPVVFLHGFLENKNMWNFMAYSDQNNIQFILIDLPGHGNSPVYEPVHSMGFMAEKVHEILEEEKIKNYHVMGHSMGGYVALALAEQNPKAVNSLGLLFSTPFSDTPERKEQRLKAAEIAEKNKKDFVRLGVRALFNPHRINDLQEEVDEATAMAMNTPDGGIAPALRGMRERPDRSDVLETTIFPKLWIYGEYDPVVNVEEVQNYLAGKDKIQDYRLPIGHMGHLESPDILSTIIFEFLNTI